MYENHFGFVRRPFTATPDPELFVASAQTAHETISQCLRSGQGIAILTAPAGLGKSMTCSVIAADLRPDFAVVTLSTPNATTRLDLLQAIYYGLGHRPRSKRPVPSEQAIRHEMAHSLRALRVRSSGVVLIVDEAHLLTPELIEELRTLVDLSDHGQPLVRLLMAGSTSLEERLADPCLRAFNERIRCQCYLETLTRAETAEYIETQMRASGVRGGVFNPDAIELIARAADGVPRCINQLCDHSLVLTAAQQQEQVCRDIVSEALSELKQLPLQWAHTEQDLSAFESSAPSTPEIQPVAPVTSSGGSAVLEVGAAPCETNAGPVPEPVTTDTSAVASEASTVEIGAATVEIGSDCSENTASSTNDGADETCETVGTEAISSMSLSMDDDSACDELEETEEQGTLFIDVSTLLPEESPEPAEPHIEIGSVDADSDPPESTWVLGKDEEAVSDRYTDAELGRFVPGTDTRSVTSTEVRPPIFDPPDVAQELLIESPACSEASSEPGNETPDITSVSEPRSTDPASERSSLDLETEQALLASCTNTRREIAAMLDKLEDHVNDSLIDDYDVVMPESVDPIAAQESLPEDEQGPATGEELVDRLRRAIDRERKDRCEEL